MANKTGRQVARVPHPFRSLIAEWVGYHEPQPAFFWSLPSDLCRVTTNPMRAKSEPLAPPQVVGDDEPQPASYYL